MERSKKLLKSTGQGKDVEDMLPTHSVEELAEVNLTNKKNLTGLGTIVAGTASIRSVLTQVNYGAEGACWFPTKVAGNTISQVRLASGGNDTEQASIKDGGLAVVPAGSAIVFEGVPDGTTDVSISARLTPVE